jgi:protein tyrosine/serine phosphatase
MFKRLQNRLEDLERSWRESFGLDISTPEGRRDAWRHFMIADHAALRVLWTNFHPVAPGVFRANQPSPKRLERWKDMGIKSILNLRGESRYSPYLFEREACDALGLPLTDINLSATELPSLDTIRQLELHFRSLEKPFVLHCKSGADRAGLASALYLLLIEGRPIEEAQRQLGLKYAHVRHSAKGVLYFGLEKYRRANEASPIPFRDWLETMYDPKAFYDEFHAQRRGGPRT